MKNYNLRSNLYKVAKPHQKLWLKALCLFLFGAFSIQDTNAQDNYFSHIYGDANVHETLTDGIKTNDGSYLMTGYDLNGNVIVTLADNFGVKLFSESFNIPNAVINNSKCIEHPNSTAMSPLYIIVCASVSGIIFYFEIDDAGATGPAINDISIASNALWLGDIALGSGGELYITGSSDNGNQENTFAMSGDIISLPASISLNWGGVYPVDGSFDNRGTCIIENGGDVLIIGNTINSAGFNLYGFVLPVDQPTGMPNRFSSGRAKLWGVSDAYRQAFYSVTPATGSGLGFVISGTTDESNTSLDMWTVKIDNTPSYTQSWSTYRNYSFSPPTGYPVSSPLGIVERYNAGTSGYEFFQTGTLVGGASGSIWGKGNDMVVYKLDENGNGINGTFGGQFSFSAPDGARGCAIDYDDGAVPAGNVEGLVLFGVYNDITGSPPPNSDFYLKKTYLNGFTCTTGFEDIRNLNPDNASITGTSFSGNISPSGTISIGTAPPPSPTPITTESQICSIVSDADGSNNFILHAKPKNKSTLSFSPNPFSSGNMNTANIEIQSGREREIQISLYDMLGREYINTKLITGKDKGSLELDLSQISFVPGMYVLHVNDEGKHNTLMIQIK